MFKYSYNVIEMFDVLPLLKQPHGLARAVPVFVLHLYNPQLVLGLFVVLLISPHLTLILSRVLFEESGLYEDK